MDEKQITKPKTVIYWICLTCLSLYIGYITLLCRVPLFSKACLLCLGGWIGVSVAAFAVLHFTCNVKLTLKTAKQPEHNAVFWSALLIALAVYGISLMAVWPGAVSYDASNQWQQAHTGEFNNWHPLFHTLLITLLVRIYDNYSFCVLVQIAAFALSQAWMASNVRKMGVPAWLVLILHTFVCLSPAVRNTLMFLGKDSAMTIGVLILFTQLLKMLRTDGAWLANPLHACSFGVVLMFITLVRHNAILITLPVIICSLLIFRKQIRWMALASILFLALVLLFRGPVSKTLDVVYPQNLLEESIGVPMTMAADIYVLEPEKSAQETSEFLLSLATDEAWHNEYCIHNYNSIKFTYDRELIAGRQPAELLGILLKSIANAPQTAFESFNAVTDLVWDISGHNEATVTADNSGNIESARYGIAKLNSLGRKAESILLFIQQLPPIRWLTENIGVQLLLLLIATLYSVRNRGLGALVPGLSVLVYDLATMLLLCGNDVRFFQFSLTVSLLLIPALLWWNPGKKQF